MTKLGNANLESSKELELLRIKDFETVKHHADSLLRVINKINYWVKN